MNPTENALEHGEHAAHAAHAHDRFARQVTMTIAITAALLACVTLLSHRAHNETLALQQEAAQEIIKASNQWNYYQSKKNRQYLYETAAKQSEMDREHPQVKAASATEGWRGIVDKNIDDWRKEAGRYKKETVKIEEDAHDYEKEAGRLSKESKHIHHIGNYYDLGELAIEMGLVLCSIALIAKERKLWFGSMGVTGIGTILMIVGLVQQYVVH